MDELLPLAIWQRRIPPAGLSISPSWTVVTNVFGTNAPITISDTNALAPERFYRVRRL